MTPEEEYLNRKYGWIVWTIWAIGLMTILAFSWWLLMMIMLKSA